MNELLTQALMHFAIVWVITAQATSFLHKLNFHKLDPFICLKCFTFFATLILTMNPFVAGVAALMAHIFDNYINTTKL